MFHIFFNAEHEIKKDVNIDEINREKIIFFLLKRIL